MFNNFKAFNREIFSFTSTFPDYVYFVDNFFYSHETVLLRLYNSKKNIIFQYTHMRLDPTNLSPLPHHLCCRPGACAGGLLLLPGGLVPLPGEGQPHRRRQPGLQDRRQPALPPLIRAHLLPLHPAHHRYRQQQQHIPPYRLASG